MTKMFSPGKTEGCKRIILGSQQELLQTTIAIDPVIECFMDGFGDRFKELEEMLKEIDKEFQID